MSDALDRLASAAGPLLSQVDATLAGHGASPDDPVWPLLRRVRALPSEAVAAVAAWRATPWQEAAAPLRALARRHAEAVEQVPPRPAWEGASAEAYAVRWASLRAHVSGTGAESLVGRLVETAAFLEAAADWIARSRHAVARALADALGSAEAVAVTTGLEPAGPAAARLAAHLLAPVAWACDDGQRLREEWHGRLGELAWLPPGTPGRGADGSGALRVSA